MSTRSLSLPGIFSIFLFIRVALNSLWFFNILPKYKHQMYTCSGSSTIIKEGVPLFSSVPSCNSYLFIRRSYYLLIFFFQQNLLQWLFSVTSKYQLQEQNNFCQFSFVPGYMTWHLISLKCVLWAQQGREVTKQSNSELCICCFWGSYDKVFDPCFMEHQSS